MEINNLAKHSLIYAASSILTQFFSLLTVPVFTKYMTLDEFGQYSLFTSIQSLLAIFITLGIYSGMTRFINEFQDKNRTKNIVLTFSIIFSILIFFVSFLLKNKICDLIFPGESGKTYFVTYLILSSIFLCLISIYNSYYVMLFKSKTVCIMNLIRASLLLLLSIYFIIIKENGLLGALQAQLYAVIIVFIGLLLYDLKNIKLIISRKELKIMLSYSIGLVPGQASAWVYTLLDRYFIQIYIGLQQVAIYSMGYKIGMLMEPILISPFKSVFTAFKYKVYKEADAPLRFKKVYIYYNFISWFCVLGFSVFAKPAILLLATPKYVEAFKVVPLIVFSYFLYGLGEFYSLGIHIKNKPMLDSLILAAGAVSNIILNFALIPSLGINGAAFATIFSYLIMNVLYFFIGRKYLDLGLKYLEAFKGGIITLGLYIIYIGITPFLGSIILEILLALLLCSLFIIVSYLVKMIPKETFRLIYLWTCDFTKKILKEKN
ncbi:oligosaccharide flippase family protein [Dehalobacter sp. TBBPA1]|uniref:oligosaccharide flippase family protein n=1 Tax=Dehalobacter sp. TBBPA1 TaxID=3235037 RepID=UPI0034A2C423